MEAKDLSWDTQPETSQGKVYSRMAQKWAGIIPGATAGKQRGPSDNLARAEGQPLRQTLPTSLQQLDRVGQAYQLARRNARALGLSSRRPDPIRFEKPRPFPDPVVEILAHRVVTTRASSRGVGAIGAEVLQVRRVRWAAEAFVLGKRKYILLESGAGSEIGGLFTVDRKSSAQMERRLWAPDRAEKRNAFRRRKKVRL